MQYPIFILVVLIACSASVSVASFSFPHHLYKRAQATTTTRTTTTIRPIISHVCMSTKATVASPTRKRRPRPVFLTHERDFFRQEARLNSMDSYVLVSTLTASMSFGCLVGFSPYPHTNFIYKSLCLAIQAVSGLSAIFGLYATIIFSLTILYGKSALGAERDREYDKFLRRTLRARVHGAKCFSLSLALFALEALLVLLERTSQHAICSTAVGITAAITLSYLYRDWKLMFQGKDIIYKD